MRKMFLLAGVAALAAAMPVIAQPDDRGKGRGGGPRAEASEPGKGQGQGRGNGRAERGRGGGDEARGRGRGSDRQAERRAERGAERGQRNSERRAERSQRNVERRAERGVERRSERDRRGVERRAERRIDDRFDRDRFDDRRFDGRVRPVQVGFGRGNCPPGLAKQNAFCMPPGQLRKAQLLGQRAPLARLGMVPDRYLYRFGDSDRFLYRYGNDGTVYRIDRGTGLIDSVIPVLASGLFVGEPLPLGYEVYNVPLDYRGLYPNRDDLYYRYDDNAIYRVDPETRLVEGIVALLTGGSGLGSLGIGDPLPAGYDAYNVPLDYRDRYYDTPDSMYRYADGSIYQVDPETQLIQAVISLFT